MAVLLGRQPIDHFIERAIASASDHQPAPFGGSALRDFRGVARPGRFREFRFDAARRKDLPRSIDRAAAFCAAVAGVGVVNQQSVSEIRCHRWSGFR